MRLRRTIGLVITGTILAQPPHFQAAAQGFELVTPRTEETIALPVGTGQLVRVEDAFSSVFVANPEVADIQVKSPRLLYLTGVGVGETTLFAVDEEDRVLMSSDIRVTHNTGALERGLSRVAPGQAISATTVDQSLLITGSAASPEQAADILQVASQFVDDPARVVDRLTVRAPYQVNLQVRIAEVARNVDRRLGIRWNAIGLDGEGDVQLGFVGGSGVANGYGVGARYAGSRLNLDILLEALSEEGLVTILAEPNLTARSGENASFLAGGEFPYQIVTEDTYSVAFKDFGIGLDFTPIVLDSGQISLTVATEVSELNFANDTVVPSLTSRRAETTVDLASGQSFAIAGLMQNSSSQNAARLPGLGSVPVLGTLFRSSSFQRGQTELVIMVTPVIVEPSSARRLATPLDGYVPPNDFERIVLGRFQGSAEIEQVQNRIGRRKLHGTSGFVFQ